MSSAHGLVQFFWSNAKRFADRITFTTYLLRKRLKLFDSWSKRIFRVYFAKFNVVYLYLFKYLLVDNLIYYQTSTLQLQKMKQANFTYANNDKWNDHVTQTMIFETLDLYRQRSHKLSIRNIVISNIYHIAVAIFTIMN